MVDSNESGIYSGKYKDDNKSASMVYPFKKMTVHALTTHHQNCHT